jgi:hypothetical protein
VSHGSWFKPLLLIGINGGIKKALDFCRDSAIVNEVWSPRIWAASQFPRSCIFQSISFQKAALVSSGECEK